MGTIGGGNANMQSINAGSIGQFSSRLNEKVNTIDSNKDGALNVEEIKAAADSDGDNQVSESEAQAFIDELRTAGTRQEGDTTPIVRRGGDRVDEAALAKVKEAAMGPLDERIEFTFSRTRYASVFCTRF